MSIIPDAPESLTPASVVAPADAESLSSRCGFIALAGLPNSGKSTLLNALTGSRLAIVTHKAQTTRSRLRGIVIEAEAQLIFVDTPGLCNPDTYLEEAMLAAAWSGVADADFCVVVVDAARRETETARDLPHRFAAAGFPPERLWLVLNKIDLLPRKSLLPIIDRYAGSECFGEIFPISAKSGDGVAIFRQHCASRLPLGPWSYPDDVATDHSQRMLAAEITREKILRYLHEEVPYGITVETEKWIDDETGAARINQVIYCFRAGHKPIILGARGQTLQRIGAAARQSIAKQIGRPVHLFLFVKVDPQWQQRRERYEAMGLAPPPGLPSVVRSKVKAKRKPPPRTTSSRRPKRGGE